MLRKTYNWAVPLSNIILKMNKEPFYSLTQVCFTSSDFIFAFAFKLRRLDRKNMIFHVLHAALKGAER